jgi:hypothetical protein
VSELEFLDMKNVRGHYEARLRISEQARLLLQQDKERAFAELVLGIADRQGNYSASEHRLGPRILASKSPSAISKLGKSLLSCRDAKEAVDTIYRARISYLKISVGSEIAMMVKPDAFWVANTRTIWAHLLVSHDFNYDDANEELALYRDPERESEMEYRIWKDIYPRMQQTLTRLGELGDEESKRRKVRAGSLRNIWYDAIANEIYEHRT